MKYLYLLALGLVSLQTVAQNVGIDALVPTEKLEIGLGNLKLSNSDKGILLNAADRPLITRAWNPFTSGTYNGLGRWGMFMEPTRLTMGIPYFTYSGFKVSAFGANSTIIKNMMDISIDGGGIVNTAVDGRMNITHNSSQTDAQLTLTEDASDYARLTFKNTVAGSPQFWTIAGGNNPTSTTDRMNFFHNIKGDVLSLVGDGNVEVISGDLKMNNTPKGIILNGADRPLITRGYDPFTGGANNGIGRWGVFMEPSRITAGFPALVGAGFKVSAYDANSTITKNLIEASLDGSLNGVVKIDAAVTRPSTGNANLVPIAYGSITNTGVIYSGTENLTCIKTSTGVYEITIAGEYYNTLFYTSIITPTEFNAPVISAGSSASGRLTVCLWNLPGTRIDGSFHFVTYRY